MMETPATHAVGPIRQISRRVPEIEAAVRWYRDILALEAGSSRRMRSMLVSGCSPRLASNLGEGAPFSASRRMESTCSALSKGATGAGQGGICG